MTKTLPLTISLSVAVNEDGTLADETAVFEAVSKAVKDNLETAGKVDSILNSVLANRAMPEDNVVMLCTLRYSPGADDAAVERGKALFTAAIAAGKASGAIVSTQRIGLELRETYEARKAEQAAKERAAAARKAARAL